jgi:predicted nucleotidyltransferase
MGNRIGIQVPRQRIAEFCRKWGIRELSLFGSVLSDDFGPDSDIDVLVSFNLVRMERELEEIFGREVDVVSRRGIESSRNYLRRKAILDSAEAVYAA